MSHYIEAEYESGYIHRSDGLDASPYAPGRNIFYDILGHLPEQYHGKMVRWSLVTPAKRYDVSWTGLPDNARPIYFRNMERTFDQTKGWLGEAIVKSIGFGYQFTDEAGKNHKEVRML